MTKSLLMMTASASGSEVAVSAASTVVTLTFDAAWSTSSSVETLDPPPFSVRRPSRWSRRRPRARFDSSLGRITVPPCGMSATDVCFDEYSPSG